MKCLLLGLAVLGVSLVRAQVVPIQSTAAPVPLPLQTVVPTTPVAPTTPNPSLLQPNYDFPDERVKILRVRRTLELQCRLMVTGEYHMTWRRNNVDVMSITELHGRVSATADKLTISSAQQADAGMFECSVMPVNVSASINVVAMVDVSLPTDTYTTEGDKLTIRCLVVGTDPALHWRKGNETIRGSTDHIQLLPNEDGVPNAFLHIPVVSLTDRDHYTCVGENLASELLLETQTATTLLRVKDQYAALWPFIGICIEVAVVCFVIWFLERRRKRREAEEYEAEQYEANKK